MLQMVSQTRGHSLKVIYCVQLSCQISTFTKWCWARGEKNRNILLYSKQLLLIRRSRCASPHYIHHAVFEQLLESLVLTQTRSFCTSLKGCWLAPPLSSAVFMNDQQSLTMNDCQLPTQPFLLFPARTYQRSKQAP